MVVTVTTINMLCRNAFSREKLETIPTGVQTYLGWAGMSGRPNQAEPTRVDALTGLVKRCAGCPRLASDKSYQMSLSASGGHLLTWVKVG